MPRVALAGAGARPAFVAGGFLLQSLIGSRSGTPA